MEQAWPAVLFAVLLFVPIWSTVTALLSRLSGWPSLASRFPAIPEAPAGESVRGQVLGVGMVRENNVTTLIASPAGLHLSAMFLFRLGRPPVLVPWSEVRHVSERTWFGSRSHVLDLGGITTIRLKDKGYRMMESNINRPGRPTA